MKKTFNAWVFASILVLSVASGCGDDNGDDNGDGGQGGQGDGLAAPEITSPTSDPFHSNDDTLTIEGTCPEGSTVRLSGDETDEEACGDDGRFSFTITRNRDGDYDFTLRAVRDGDESDSVSQTWIRDTVSPARPTITKPADNPFRTSDTSITLSGKCEPGATVRTEGAQELSTTCTNGGNYSFSLERESGTHNYRVTQADRAGNVSVPAPFTWIIESDRPPLPRITSPDEDPVFTRKGSLTVEGQCACDADNCVVLSGDFDETTDCENKKYRFELTAETEDEYRIEVTQTVNGRRSPADTLRWIFDKTAPDAPSITDPVDVGRGETGKFESPAGILLRGECEDDATVFVTAAGKNLDDPCVNGEYRIKLENKCGRTAEVTVTQEDPAGNRSEATRLNWTRTCPENP